jgi:3-isopropylmalate dehydrogenase
VATTEFRIAVFPGDGIGQEVMAACLAVLEALEKKVGGYRLVTEVLPGGAALYRDTGTALSDENFAKAEAADAILFGAMGLPEVRHADGTEIAPHLEMRRVVRAVRRRPAGQGLPEHPGAARRPARP